MPIPYDFTKAPANYILFTKNNDVFADKKSVWTWIKANVLSKFSKRAFGDYHLQSVVDVLKKTQGLSKEILSAVNARIESYNQKRQNQKNFEQIKPLPLITSVQIRSLRGVRKARSEEFFDLLKSGQLDAVTPPTKREESPVKEQSMLENNQSVQYLLAKQDSRIMDFVRFSVREHLKPYLEGKITPESENKTRKPLVDTLYSEFKRIFPESQAKKQDLEELLLDAYFIRAAKELNRRDNTKYMPTPDFTEERDGPLDMLCEALKHSLAIDFPSKKMSLQEIKEKAIEAFSNLDEMFRDN